MFFPWRERKERKTLDEKEEKERRRKRENTQKKLFCRRCDDVYAFCATNASRLDHKNSLPTLRTREKERLGLMSTFTSLYLARTTPTPEHQRRITTMSFTTAAAQKASLAFRSTSSLKTSAEKRQMKSTSRRCVVSAEVAAVEAAKVKVTDVKETLGRGFVLVDIRSPEEVMETGSKFSWEKIPIAAMDDDGNPVSNPAFLALIKEKFPNSLSRILLACDDGTFRSELAHRLITGKLGYSQVKIIDGGIDAYIEHQPLTKEDKVKVRMVAQAGNDLSVLVNGVDTRQAGQKYY